MDKTSLWNRREIVSGLVAISISGVSGCNGSWNDPGGEEEQRDSDGDGVADEEDDFPMDSTRSKLLREDRRTFDLNEDYYQYLTFSPNQPATLAYEADVQGEVRIDVIFTDETNFNYFEDGTDWEYYQEATELDTLYVDADIRLGTGREYYLIIDNTDRGRAAPPWNFHNDRVAVDIQYELYS